MFNHVYEMYGRHVNLIVFNATRRGDRPRGRPRRRRDRGPAGPRVRLHRRAGADVGLPGRAGPPARAVHGVRRLLDQRRDTEERALPVGQPAHGRHLALRDDRLRLGQVERQGRHLGRRARLPHEEAFLLRGQRDDGAALSRLCRADGVADREAAGGPRQHGLGDLALLHARPHHAAHAGGDHRREAQGVRRHERDLRRRSHHADLPHQGRGRHRLLPRVDHHGHRPDRHRRPRAVLRPERVGARVRGDQSRCAGARRSRGRRPPLPLVVRGQHLTGLLGGAGAHPAGPTVLHRGAAGRARPHAGHLRHRAVPRAADRRWPHDPARGLRLSGRGTVPELLVTRRLHLLVVRRHGQGARRGGHQRHRADALRQRRRPLQVGHGAGRAGADVHDGGLGHHLHVPARPAALLPGLAGSPAAG